MTATTIRHRYAQGPLAAFILDLGSSRFELHLTDCAEVQEHDETTVVLDLELSDIATVDESYTELNCAALVPHECVTG